jgi:hypothetical protein
VYDGGDRNVITACLGEARSDEETGRLCGHPAIEYLRGPARPGRLLFASDGAYEPHVDAGHDLAAYLTGDPHTAAERLFDDAVRRAHELNDPYADNVACGVPPLRSAVACLLALLLAPAAPPAVVRHRVLPSGPGLAGSCPV